MARRRRWDTPYLLQKVGDLPPATVRPIHRDNIGLETRGHYEQLVRVLPGAAGFFRVVQHVETGTEEKKNTHPTLPLINLIPRHFIDS